MKSNSTANRLIFLDAIRGVAALFVLARHTPGLWGGQLPYSYLAVDIFFILSGFVIAHAYDNALSVRRISARHFMLVRFIRLYPIFILSVALCASVAILRLLHSHQADANTVLSVLLSALLTALFVPSIMSADESLFPLNGVYWSLFFELIVNVAYAKLRPALTNRRLTLCVVTSAAALCLMAYHNNGLDLGYSWSVDHIAGGFIRAIFGITLGLLMHRCRDSIKLPQIPWLGVIMVVAVLGQSKPWHYSWIFDIGSVLIVLPLATWTAATHNRSRAEHLLLALGSASYPIYVFHIPVAQITAALFKGANDYQPFIGVAFAALAVVLGIAVERIYDIPIRRRLSTFLLSDRQVSAAMYNAKTH